MQAQDVVRMKFAQSPQMVDCHPASTVPCFRLRLNFTDERGAAASASLPPEADLAGNITVRVSGHEVKPFYARAGDAQSGALRKRIAVVLVDVSGSMQARLPSGETRFEAARAAAEVFADQFEVGADQVAIVPFSSHSVVSTVRSAKFASSPADVRQQIRELPVPERRNNTAFYSAIEAALDLLAEVRKGKPDAEVILVAMTDGKNDVRPGDDPDLRQGAQDLEEVARKVRASGLQVIGVGFGQPASLDQDAMRRLSTQAHFVESAGALRETFSIARKLLHDRLHLVLAAPWSDRASLAGRDIGFQVLLTTRDGAAISSDELVWETPQLGVPAYEGRCDASEMRAALNSKAVPQDTGWIAVVRPTLVFLGLGSVLLVLWFWVPRLIWPDQYLGNLRPVYRRYRWSDSRARKRGEDTDFKRKAPPGFGRRDSHPVMRERAPSDATVAQPRTDFGTRTRLDFD